MKLKLSLIAVSVTMASLSACGGGGGGGGGGGDSTTGSSGPASTNATTVDPLLKISDTSVGSGTMTISGSTVNITYTGWLYDATKTDHKGKQFDAGTFSFVIGSGQVIPGFDQAVLNMKAGGQRTVEIPPNLGYGADGYPPNIPGNATLVFDITLNSVR